MIRSTFPIFEIKHSWLRGFRAIGLFCMCLCSIQCLPNAERACRTSADCVQAGEKKHCLQGWCSIKACVAGTQEACFDGPSDKKDKGICRSGQRFCNDAGQWSTCIGQILPRNEICDRLDNDCDGTIDQKPNLDCTCTPGAKRSCYSGDATTLGKGVCKEGVQVCEIDARWGPCLEEGLPAPERCNQQDDDCNGLIDDGLDCKCAIGATQPCYDGPESSRGVGSCRGGVQTCGNDQRWGLCQGQVLPTLEICNGLDDDCNGVIDSPSPSCAGSLVCRGGACVCPDTFTLCQSQCVDVKTDARHCGTCSNLCKEGQFCKEGQCICPDGLQLCADRCVSVQTNRQHCGTCGKSCATGEACVAAVCVACLSNQQACGGECCPQPLACCSNVCTDSKQNPQHCGTCGNRCIGGQVCCNGTCTDLTQNKEHCGACGQVCKSGEVCCQGECRDIQNNAQHCGGCRQSCATGQACCQATCQDLSKTTGHCGQCGKACAGGEVCCFGQCVNPKANALHCGSCGTVCQAPTSACCDGKCLDVSISLVHCGSCGITCTTGKNCCLGQCAEMMSDLKHCGACGQACKNGEVCCEGSCVPASTCPSVLLWKPSGEADVRAIHVASNGDIILSGVFWGSLSLSCGNPAQTITLATRNTTDRDFFVARFSAQNQCIWAMAGGGTGTDQWRGMAVDSNDITVLIGTLESTQFRVGSSTNLLVGVAAGEQYPFILQIRGDGSVQFLKVAPVNTLKWSAVAVAGSRIYVAGETTDSLTLDGAILRSLPFSQDTTVTKTAMILAAYDTSQTGWGFVWSPRFLGENDLYYRPTSLRVVTASNSLFVGGSTNSKGFSWPSYYQPLVGEFDLTTGTTKGLATMQGFQPLQVQQMAVTDLDVLPLTQPRPTVIVTGYARNFTGLRFASDGFIGFIPWNAQNFSINTNVCHFVDTELVRMAQDSQGHIWAVGHSLSAGQISGQTTDPMFPEGVLVACIPGSPPTPGWKLRWTASSVPFSSNAIVQPNDLAITSQQGLVIGGRFRGIVQFPPKSSSTQSNGYLPSGFVWSHSLP